MDVYSSVIVTGTMAYDEIMDFPGKFVDYFHPEKLHQINISFVVSRLEKELGGTATNIAYNLFLATQSLQKKITITPIASVGKDGQKLIDFFRKNNISTKGILRDRRLYTATGKVITDKKDNQIWGYYYGASKSATKINSKEFSNSKSVWIISANHPDAFLHFQNQVIINNNTYIYDPGMSLTWIKDKDLKQGVMNAQYLVGNDYEIAMIIKRLNISINQLIDTGINAITTLGEKGVRYESKSEKLEVKSYQVKKIIDPTGAGDAWRGGFIAGIVCRLPIKTCLKLGNVMASFAIEMYGTVNHRPTTKEIAKRLKSL